VTAHSHLKREEREDGNLETRKIKKIKNSKERDNIPIPCHRGRSSIEMTTPDTMTEKAAATVMDDREGGDGDSDVHEVKAEPTPDTTNILCLKTSLDIKIC